MAYTVLDKMREENKKKYAGKYEGEIGPKTEVFPDISENELDMRLAAIRFIREHCEGLRFKNNGGIDDEEGNSGGRKIPYDMEKDIDRMCLEKAVDRFIKSGRLQDAFDVYFCYIEMFIGKYSKLAKMIELLSEYEHNGSSLLMKHRDHYSHSVYVFALGLAIFETNASYRKIYAAYYGLEAADSAKTANHYLEFWGMSSLFHDIGYPFELPFEQVCAYFEIQGEKRKNNPFLAYSGLGNFGKLDSALNDKLKTIYGLKEPFADINDLFAFDIAEKLGKAYHVDRRAMKMTLECKPTSPDGFGFFMDHAYFSATMLLRQLSKVFPAESFRKEYVDALTAIVLHNSLYKHSITYILNDELNSPFKAEYHPLAYMLMLCDELQCWDRTSYGRNSRTEYHPFDCRFVFDNGTIRATYVYDEAEKDRTESAKPIKAYSKMAGENNKFQKEIEDIVDLSGDIKLVVTTTFDKVDRRKKSTYLSNGNFLNIYNFAMAMNAQYSDIEDPVEMAEEFEKLSLEYKLSNVEQVKGFAAHLNVIDCFYTDEPVDFDIVSEFSDSELSIIAPLEHIRWMEEKIEMNWQKPTGEMLELCSKDKQIRELTRMHKDFVAYDDLTEEEKLKDIKPLNIMLKKLKEFDGTRIYCVKGRE